MQNFCLWTCGCATFPSLDIGRVTFLPLDKGRVTILQLNYGVRHFRHYGRPIFLLNVGPIIVFESKDLLYE